jgi:ParB-like chromosome segregation protein Spo0J
MIGKRIEIRKIRIPKDYPRKKVDLHDFQGVMTYPIVVDQNNNLVDGLRRLEFLRRQPRTRMVNVIVRTIPKGKLLEVSLQLAMQHKDLNPMEKAFALRSYIDSFDPPISMRQAAGRLGMGKTNVEDHMKLLSLPKDVQRQLFDGELKMYQIPGLYHEKFETVEQFNRANSDKKYVSVINRISALDRILAETPFEKDQIETLIRKLKNIKFMLEKRLENGK